MNILDPPRSYVDFRCALYGVPDDETSEKKKKFYKANEGYRAEILRFMKWLQDARAEMALPIEMIEVREIDGKYHGRVEKMMIYDIEYWISGDRIMQRKLYIPVDRICEHPILNKKKIESNHAEKDQDNPPF